MCNDQSHHHYHDYPEIVQLMPVQKIYARFIIPVNTLNLQWRQMVISALSRFFSWD